MKHSEFWKAVETVYGSAYGSSLAQDLVVPGLRATCAEALDAGVPPREVWHALCDETRVSDADRWVFARTLDGVRLGDNRHAMCSNGVRTHVRLQCSTDDVRAPRVHKAR